MMMILLNFGLHLNKHTATSSSSSRMRVMNRNWSATKQRLNPQSVAEISRHSQPLIGHHGTCTVGLF